jgi:septal ring factor EnvC (AmiA/AmiB activator)
MDTQKVKELYKKHTTNENNLEELEKWITEYDEPIERSSVADIFYDLKDEITYLKMEINMCEKAIEEDEKTKQRLCDQIDKYEKALEKITNKTMSMYLTPKDMAKDFKKIAMDALNNK